MGSVRVVEGEDVDLNQGTGQRTKSRVNKIPNKIEFVTVANNAQIQTAIIMTNVVLENMLELAISEVLAERHYLELRRVPFPLKLDLAIALKLLPIESRPVYVKVNALRNRYAHDWKAELKDKDIEDLVHCLSDWQRQAFGISTEEGMVAEDKLRICFLVLYIELKSIISHIRDQAVREREWHNIAEELLTMAKSPRTLRDDDPDHLRVEAKVQEERKKREANGEL